MKGADAYDDPAKDAWRGWKWNTIVSLITAWFSLPPKEKARRCSEKTVLYLPGPDDHDRRRAMARGFANYNLIAVDVVQDRIDRIRANGGFGIRGSLQQVILNWPEDWPIDVIDGDFCGGLTEDVSQLAWCLYSVPAVHPDTILSLNLMRGRDPRAKEWQDMAKSVYNSVPSYLQPLVGKTGTQIDFDDIVKHRGHLWLWRLLSFHASVDPGLQHEDPREWVPSLLRAIEIQENSYRSKTSGQYFDSVIHRWATGNVFRGLAAAAKKTRVASLVGHKESFATIANDIKGRLSRLAANDRGLRARIAALRAVRKKYLNKHAA